MSCLTGTIPEHLTMVLFSNNKVSPDRLFATVILHISRIINVNSFLLNFLLVLPRNNKSGSDSGKSSTLQLRDEEGHDLKK